MSRKSHARRSAAQRQNSAKFSAAAKISTMKISASPTPGGPADELVNVTKETLEPIYPDPDEGFQELSGYLVERITEKTMKHMARLIRERHVPLNLKYWKKITRSILGQPSNDKAIVIPSPAGSGKSTWILAFLLAWKDILLSEPEFAASLVGVAVVLQKVEDLNTLADELNQGSPPDQPVMVPLQGWSQSGRQRGFCQDAGVESYEDCQRNRCPYAEQCPIRRFRKAAPFAPIVGLTQERFYLLQQSDLSMILQRMGQDGQFHPRRYILFDEKYKMVPTTALSVEQINDASSEFNRLINKLEISDSFARWLQQRLGYSVQQVFQRIRKEQRTDSGQDIPVGFLQLSAEEQAESHTYYEFRELVTASQGRYMSKPLSAVLSVMDYLYEGGTCLFTKTNGFCIYRIDPPQLQFGDCQTLIFDATAEVDRDYSYLDNVKILPGPPHSSSRSVHFYIHNHQDLNVSKNAMKKPWKLPAFAEYTAQLIRGTDKPVFICTYKQSSIELAGRLQDLLSKEDFKKVLIMPQKDLPTIPYFNGTNGSNDFNRAETVILLGYPRLDPSTYLGFACAACGKDRIADELDTIPEENLLNPKFNPLDLPSVRDYVAHHLAARLEQEIYRSAQRDPGFTGEINIHLFCPPQDAWEILRDRIPGEVMCDGPLPACVERWKGSTRHYDGGSTSFGRLVQFIEEWDGTASTAARMASGSAR